jgi:putative lipoic acid-binding regulatory protein
MKIKEDIFCGNKINFPIIINLKVITNNTFPDLVNRTHIGMAIEEAGLEYNEIRVTESKNKNYLSYTIIINIESEILMHKLYERIKQTPGFVMAI